MSFFIGLGSVFFPNLFRKGICLLCHETRIVSPKLYDKVGKKQIYLFGKMREDEKI